MKHVMLMIVSLALSWSLFGCINHDASKQEPTSGSLDTGFGDGGRATAAIGSYFAFLKDIAIQPDGSIVAVGHAGYAKFAVARFTADGSLDTTFNDTGKVTTSIGNSEASAVAVALQADGKIVVAGRAGHHDFANFFALARYDINGSLDTSFGTGGTVTTSIGDTAVASAVAVQADGKIVAAGRSSIGESQYFSIARYNVDGGLDTGFGIAGIVSTAVGTTPDIGVSDLFIHPDGKIMAVGTTSSDEIGSIAVAFIRYNTDGSLDTSFGSDGIVMTAAATFAATAFARQNDGKIVAVGISALSGVHHPQFALTRFNIDGSLDTSFGTNGMAIASETNGYAYDLAIQADGKIVAAGFSTGSSLPMFTLVRYTMNGSIDTSFNNTGIVTAQTENGDYATAVAVRPDGKIVVAGFSIDIDSDAPSSVFAISQYWP